MKFWPQFVLTSLTIWALSYLVVCEFKSVMEQINQSNKEQNSPEMSSRRKTAQLRSDTSLMIFPLKDMSHVSGWYQQQFKDILVYGLFAGSWENAVKTSLHTVDYMDHG